MDAVLLKWRPGHISPAALLRPLWLLHTILVQLRSIYYSGRGVVYLFHPHRYAAKKPYRPTMAGAFFPDRKVDTQYQRVNKINRRLLRGVDWLCHIVRRSQRVTKINSCHTSCSSIEVKYV